MIKKNLSIRELSIYIALFMAVLVALVEFLLLYLLGDGWRFLPGFILFLFTFITAYIILQQFLENYVFRKIKLIYKIIARSKGSNSKEQRESTNSLDQVNDEVVDWAKETASEIKSLHSLEEYRRHYVGNISHELKTPIFSIQGYLHTLLDGGMYDESILRKYLEKASSNTDRLQTIVEDLELISKLEGNEPSIEYTRFDVKGLVEEVLSDLEIKAAEKSIKLKLKESDNTKWYVYADRENIRQVLNNLLVNSIKYGKKGGTSRVSFHDIPDNVLIEVSDNGIGIEEKHLNHLFDRFYRVEKSRNRNDGGSGLGLAIVKHIIEAHGQTINIRSTHGAGSTFGFTLVKQKPI
jgi:two-component system, OmpR family, phosphate regulon sensor histidine kinase PhoR